MEPGRDQDLQEAAEPSEDMDVACDTGATSSGQNNSELHEAPVEPVRSYPKPTHRHKTKNTYSKKFS